MWKKKSDYSVVDGYADKIQMTVDEHELHLLKERHPTFYQQTTLLRSRHS